MAKFRHIAAKLAIAPGMSVAEIGSGWGGLAIYLAKTCGARVTAINVSPEQLAASRVEAEEAGVADRVTFVEQDYRELPGHFDRVVSVGMMEHVGIAHFDEYFATIRRSAGARRLRPRSCHRTDVAARLDGALHSQIHFSGRLCAGPVGGVRLDRADWRLGRRLRDPPPALLLDDQGVAATVRRLGGPRSWP